MPHAICCKDLYKRYDSGKKSVDAVNGLDLDVHKAECFGLLGPNGAGKTTTVEILEGLLTKTSGTVEVLGTSWGAGQDHELRQRIGITLQETKLQEKLTVLETLRMFHSFYDKGIAPETAMQQVALQEKADAWVRKLSGGQKQRLAVACALVGDPELLFLDEPTTGLDPQARRQLWDVVNSLKASGTTILLTTHYMDEAEKLCDRVAIVDHGKVIALGSPRSLIAQMGGEHVIEFELEEEERATNGMSEFAEIPSVRSVTRELHGFLLTVEEPHVAIPAILQFIDANDHVLTSLTTRHVNLEDVFVNLTGRHLSDE
ncbi:MAG: ABC transporter ATP-binding protein [Planctomycetota bacterium]|jgi:ABC-2 type transport system ATP-binding protein